MLAPEVLLRPDQPDLRLIAIDEDKARLAVRIAGVVLGLGTVLVSVMPVLRAAGFPQSSAQALALIVGTLMMIIAGWGIWRVLDHAYTRNAALGLGLVLLIWLVWSVAVVRVDFALYHGLVWSMGIIAAVIALDRLLALHAPPPDGQASPASRTRTLAVVTLRRSLFAIVGTLVAGLIARLWLVDILGIVSQETWAQVREAVITALAVIVIGYVIYQVLSAWIEAKLGASHAALQGDSDEDLAPASRFESVLPLLRGVFGALILATATLVALSHLGISVAPLIAGAGIFGLAVSFGSQALVRDIVSGVFYLSDDAFRVGEYISAGSHKGTVERIALRSLRVRHQNGQVHTIPYGQLGAVTNFSRDYQIVKFNLRLARNTDVEKVRKISKKLGQEMMDDAELAKEFIVPFKLQGVADIQENALVCRFKFTARPTKPTWVQREVLKRLYQRFTDEGIEFATNAVVIQGAPGTSQEASAGAAQVLTFPRADAKD
jgi:small-conductance mechanosensitive channel